MTMAEAFERGGAQAWRREREDAPEHVREYEELDAARGWLRDVEAEGWINSSCRLGTTVPY
jgi:hypothetical protein